MTSVHVLISPSPSACLYCSFGTSLNCYLHYIPKHYTKSSFIVSSYSCFASEITTMIDPKIDGATYVDARSFDMANK